MEKMGKVDSNSQHVEGAAQSSGDMEAGKQEAFYVEDRVAHLSEEHRQYLLARHGTLDLDPIPDMNDADPYNWPQWRVSNRIFFILQGSGHNDATKLEEDQSLTLCCETEKFESRFPRLPCYDWSFHRIGHPICLYQHIR